ncbi:hypothetical protein M3196_06670 [Fictibacillus nanhaiensis]|uniref:hypothetical protein n=1 Tax=Fictibacillus nanhaiensis TaxID=742169 RepID=UPI00203D2E35|nr:hypothetical protein [Fictibacillus nanhaiensis]MCM3731344.1 hypothetical protein [Fictibacillus nanhaiensis]
MFKSFIPEKRGINPEIQPLYPRVLALNPKVSAVYPRVYNPRQILPFIFPRQHYRTTKKALQLHEELKGLQN